MEYLPRLADAMLERRLTHAGAVCIRGPKWCGKTSTALQKASSALFLQDPDSRVSNLRLAREKPSILLRGSRPRLIDEWQDAPQLWDAVRFAVDQEGGRGLFMLTGSSTPGEKPSHSGTGRFSFLDMRPMSLYESGDSTGEVSLEALFSSLGDPEGYSACDVEDIAYLVCHGGWPQIAHDKDEGALEIAYDYVSAIVEEDISRTDGVQRSSEYARLLLAEYARNTATMVSLNSMRGNVAAHGREVSRPTVYAYLAALRRLRSASASGGSRHIHVPLAEYDSASQDDSGSNGRWESSHGTQGGTQDGGGLRIADRSPHWQGRNARSFSQQQRCGHRGSAFR